MEFENNTPAREEDRRLAEAKKLTLTPLHSDVTPEPEPDAEIVARHLQDGVVANVPIDTEQSGRIVQPSKGLLESTQPVKRWAALKPSFIVLTIMVVGGLITVGIVLKTLL